MTTDWLNENHVAAASEATGIPKGVIRAAVRGYFDVAYPDEDKPVRVLDTYELPDLPARKPCRRNDMTEVKLEPKLYANFLHAGSFFSESSSREVATDDPIPPGDWPKGAYGYSLTRVLEGVSPGGKKITTDREEFGKAYYKGKVYTLAEVRAGVERGDKTFTDTLLSNMECNNWNLVLLCAQGMIPLQADAVVFEP